MARGLVPFLAAGAVGCGANGVEDASGGDGLLGQVKERLMSAWTYVQGQSQGFGFAEILTTGSANMYGVIRGPDGSCGVTFISKHYAITASHCVAGLTGNFEIDQILTPNLNLTALNNSESISGTFPNWVSGHTLTASDGYNQTAMTCTVKYRCDTSDGPLPAPNCTASPMNGANGKDIALVYCSGRTATSYLTVNTGDPTSGNVVVNWFHEVLNLPTSSNDPYHTAGNWVNYGCFYDSNTPGCSTEVNNFHYTNVMHAQFLPLQSLNWPGGPNYAINANSSGATWNDAPVCHGTSGSGVFITGTSTLLGPVLSPGAIMNGRLCADMLNAQHGARNMAYGNAPITRALQAASVVQADR
jgi:hypothetical protein